MRCMGRFYCTFWLHKFSFTFIHMAFSYYVPQKNESRGICSNIRVNKWCFGYTTERNCVCLVEESLVSWRSGVLKAGAGWVFSVLAVISGPRHSLVWNLILDRWYSMTSPSAEDIPGRAAGVRITLHQTHASPVWASVGVCDHRDVH